ncbi:uncharacterized protein LOC131239585 isoform X2 [Magnolia sinica]|uniref:uncharacterized protein LOC131239585 isoform X2 n=2 Tax=Magnolia sinica TaxID=86752 RepID=UPI002657B7B8|nr:uncharacterized protein LOC131239585 isoform X2 [Magnolia sinica]XP_058093345.1 uncharacterized protein LOC131239585 isoform X2 [Magnolia sinica]XP_058093346.1 uncharacterized protein LOC131239585 isoform X2 [Magnolia sinica]XP_058093347.1 uncharacterized protein LOC131239585 isoform X2 [Magnolia sinica]
MQGSFGHVVYLVGFKMFLGVTASVMNWDADGTSCSLVLEDKPLVDFVELPDTCQGLCYCNILSGVIRGALEMTYPNPLQDNAAYSVVKKKRKMNLNYVKALVSGSLVPLVVVDDAPEYIKLGQKQEVGNGAMPASISSHNRFISHEEAQPILPVLFCEEK